jgi:hypothetical protein
MDLADTPICSFVVRLWIEESKPGMGSVTWRGHVTDVLRNERRHVSSLPAITDAMAPRLLELGVRFGWSWHLGFWLRQRRSSGARRAWQRQDPTHLDDEATDRHDRSVQ